MVSHLWEPQLSARGPPTCCCLNRICLGPFPRPKGEPHGMNPGSPSNGEKTWCTISPSVHSTFLSLLWVQDTAISPTSISKYPLRVCAQVPPGMCQACRKREACPGGPAAESTLRGSRWSPVPHPQSGSLACSTTPIPPTRPSGSSLWVGRAGSHRMEARYSVVRTLVTRCQGVKGSRRGKLRPFSTPLYSSCWEEEASSHQACPLAQSLPSFRFLM